MSPATKTKNYWIGICITYVLVLYATLPLGRPLVNMMRDHLDKSEQILLINYFFGAAALAILIYLFAKVKSFSLCAIVSLLVLARLYYFEFTTLVKYPEERLHFIEYGVLVLLLYRAFAFKLSGLWPYFLTAATGCLIGLGDEFVQYLTKFLPQLFELLQIDVDNAKDFRRYFSWSDVRLNCKAVFYGLAVLITVIQNRRK